MNILHIYNHYTQKAFKNNIIAVGTYVYSAALFIINYLGNSNSFEGTLIHNIS